jgi:hypothetical protein
MKEGAEDHFELVLYILVSHLKIVLDVVSCQIPANLLYPQRKFIKTSSSF